MHRQRIQRIQKKTHPAIRRVVVLNLWIEVAVTFCVCYFSGPPCHHHHCDANHRIKRAYQPSDTRRICECDWTDRTNNPHVQPRLCSHGAPVHSTSPAQTFDVSQSANCARELCAQWIWYQAHRHTDEEKNGREKMCLRLTAHRAQCVSDSDIRSVSDSVLSGLVTIVENNYKHPYTQNRCMYWICLSMADGLFVCSFIHFFNNIWIFRKKCICLRL